MSQQADQPQRLVKHFVNQNIFNFCQSGFSWVLIFTGFLSFRFIIASHTIFFESAKAQALSYLHPQVIQNIMHLYNMDTNFDKSQNFVEMIKSRNVMKVTYLVRGMISKLIEEISSLYRKFQLNYQVYQFETSLIRMLIPIEVNSIYDRTEIQHILNFNQVSFRNQDYFNHKERVNDGDRSNGLSFSEKLPKLERGHNGQSKQNYSDKIDNYINKINYFPGSVTRTGKRSRGLEDKIKKWAETQMQQQLELSKKTIMMKASELGKEVNFKGCPRWCDNFINRNHHLKKYIKQVSKSNKFEKMHLRQIIKPTFCDESVERQSYDEDKDNHNVKVFYEIENEDENDCKNEPYDFDGEESGSMKLEDSDHYSWIKKEESKVS